MASSSSSTLFCLFFFASAAMGSVSANLFIVGGAFGWEVPPVNQTQLYYIWALRRQFFVGDTLRFRYRPADSVVIIPKWAYDHCDERNPIAVFKGGDTLINLDKPGTMCFITGDANRCKRGMKMMLEVKNADPEETNPSVAPPPSISNATVPVPSISNATVPVPSISNATVPVPSQVLSLAPSRPDSMVSFAVSKLTALIVFVFNL